MGAGRSFHQIYCPNLIYEATILGRLMRFTFPPNPPSRTPDILASSQSTSGREGWCGGGTCFPPTPRPRRLALEPGGMGQERWARFPPQSPLPRPLQPCGSMVRGEGVRIFRTGSASRKKDVGVECRASAPDRLVRVGADALVWPRSGKRFK